MLHKRLTIFSLSLLFFLSCVFIATGQEASSIEVGPEDQRQFEDAIPKHLPIKIKIKKEIEKGFRDLKNENWAREFELEVTNTGNKLIYCLKVHLDTDVIAAGGYRIIFQLDFGQIEFCNFRPTEQPDSDDIAIKPGETYGAKFHLGALEAWEFMNRKENRPHPKKLRARIQLISFGDGTGYGGTDGQAIPRKLN